MTHPDLGRKVARHANETATVHDILSTLERRQKRLRERVRQVDEVDGRREGIGPQLAIVIDLVSRGRR